MLSLPRPGRAHLDFAGGTAVVTGAAGGLGEHLARRLASQGSHLALVDRKEAELTALGEQLQAVHPDLRISTHVVDLAESPALEALAGAVLRRHGGVSLLVNNAGVALAGTFDQLSMADIDWLLAVNLRAPIALTKAFLPALTARPGAHVVAISSLFGLAAPAGQTAYAASKFGLRGFSQALRAELAEHAVGVTTVHPAGVATRIAQDSRTGAGLDEHEARAGREAFDRLLTMDPDTAARIILDGTRRRRARVLVGGASVALDLAERLVPLSGSRLLSAAAKRALVNQPRHLGAPAGSPGRHGSTTSSVSTVEAAGTRVRVRVTGPAGPGSGTAVLVHGIGRSLQDWDEQHARLSERYRVVSLDLPGFGLSPRSPAGMGLDALADATVATLDALGETDPVHLVGNSLGGAVAMTALCRYPDRVRTLTLADSAGFGRQVTANLRVLAVPLLGPRLLSRPTRKATSAVERSLYADPRLATPERVDLALRLARVPGRAQAFRESLLSLGTVRGVRPGWRHRLLDEARSHAVPTLLVWGKQDAVLPASQLRDAARAFPHARTVLLTDAGHLPQVERPDRFAAEVLRLWADADAGRRPEEPAPDPAGRSEG